MDAVAYERLDPVRAEEEDLPLVREVAEERAPRQARARSELGHGDLVVAGVPVELERGFLEPVDGIGFPAGHDSYAT